MGRLKCMLQSMQLAYFSRRFGSQATDGPEFVDKKKDITQILTELTAPSLPTSRWGAPAAARWAVSNGLSPLAGDSGSTCRLERVSHSARMANVASFSPEESRVSVNQVLVVALLTTLAGGLRLFHLTARSLSADDGYSVFVARAHGASFLHSIVAELNMALYYLLLHLWAQFGIGEFWLRLLSVLLATATVPATYFVGVRLFGRSTAVLAALLFAVHPFQIELSQAVRSYGLVVLLVVLSSLCVLRLLENASVSNQILYVLVSAGAIYSQFLAGLV
ncbi:MAG: glycosyltransferase family 39 protein, partial [Candidatus Korobacteraceae bacterium]